MTETDLQTSKRAQTGLSAMLLPELRALAGQLGIKGTSGMRKGALIDVIRAKQQGGAPKSAPHSAAPESAAPEKSAPERAATADTRNESAGPRDNSAQDGASKSENPDNLRPDNQRRNVEQSGDKKSRDENRNDRSGNDSQSGDNGSGDGSQPNRDRNRNRNRDRNQGGNNQGGNNQGGRNNGNQDKQQPGDKQNQDRQNPDKQNSDKQNQGGGPNQGNRQNNNDDDGDGGRRRGGRRFRERRRGRDRNMDGGGEPTVNEGDTVAPVAGILDVLDNYAFVRTSGYLAGSNDVYVSMNLVRRNGLRRGDAITGAVKVPKDGGDGGGGHGGNQRQKFNPLVRLDTVNGADVESARKRPDFNKLTPLYPNQRLRLETTPDRISTRVIDLVMPIGKGQRALIVSPPKAGKTTVLQDIANAIATNNPECHLMVVLVDERPEEVTDMTRSVNGEVIASTFDRPPSDHTSVAELAIERAKRLVEAGKDVVVLLDSITRLGRAYNNASPASGRILSGGVDSTALYPPKRFLGAARNIENGGSLTIIASALVETGSTGDTVIFEEFKGTGNAELKLDRKISERRVFPAVDVNLSSTRKDELLLSPDEFAIVHKLRRLLSGLDSQAAIDLLVNQLKKSGSNVEFLMQVQKNAPGVVNDN
ncbi:transcription termination factor Rho [Gordonia zhaorongruii]|uniref:transcription termination factor Rho n=1 Tax=Gordonia zhaorongruii TaxID=2597659 RepID=UPI0039A20FCA